MDDDFRLYVSFMFCPVLSVGELRRVFVSD
jgi:hypothetical protein